MVAILKVFKKTRKVSQKIPSTMLSSGSAVCMSLLVEIVKLFAHHFPLCDTLQMDGNNMQLFVLPCEKQLYFLPQFTDYN